MNTKSLFVLTILTVAIVWGLVSWGSKTNPQKNSENSTPGIETIADPDELVLGPTEAPVQILEYSDIQCPACAFANQVINQVLANNPQTVQLVYRHFPLSYHSLARPGALALQASQRQGRFQEMKDALFTQQESLTEERIRQIAQEIGLDMDKYDIDVTDAKLKNKIEANLQEGLSKHITGTPTIFLNGQELTNFADPNSFQQKIDEILKALENQ